MGHVPTALLILACSLATVLCSRSEISTRSKAIEMELREVQARVSALKSELAHEEMRTSKPLGKSKGKNGNLFFKDDQSEIEAGRSKGKTRTFRREENTNSSDSDSDSDESDDAECEDGEFTFNYGNTPHFLIIFYLVMIVWIILHVVAFIPRIMNFLWPRPEHAETISKDSPTWRDQLEDIPLFELMMSVYEDSTYIVMAMLWSDVIGGPCLLSTFTRP